MTENEPDWMKGMKKDIIEISEPFTVKNIYGQEITMISFFGELEDKDD